MIIIMAFVLMGEPSRAAKPSCEQTFIKQCKTVVHGAVLRPTAGAGAEARAQCTELLDACQTSCRGRVHMCRIGMTAPMNLAARTEIGAREPSSEPAPEPVPPRTEDRHAEAPSVVTVEF